MALKWVWKMNENGQGCTLHACWGGVATYRHKNWPVLLSKNRICLSSCAVMVIGMVGWLMTRLIWLLPLESAHNIHILTHNVLPAQSSLSCRVFTRRLHKFTTDNLPQKSLSRDNHNPQFPWHQKLPSTFYEQSGRSENLAKKTTWLEPTIRHLLQNKITIIFFFSHAMWFTQHRFHFQGHSLHSFSPLGPNLHHSCKADHCCHLPSLSKEWAYSCWWGWQNRTALEKCTHLYDCF